MVHGYAHLAIAGRFKPLLDAKDIDGFVARSLGPVLDAVLKGSVPTSNSQHDADSEVGGFDRLACLVQAQDGPSMLDEPCAGVCPIGPA